MERLTLEQYLLEVIWPAFLTTINVMTWTVLISTVVGFVLAVVMNITKEDGLHPNRYISRTLDFLINLIRSFPFVILMVSLIPVTRFITGSSIGVKAAIFPLCITMAPYMGRLIQSHMEQVSKETIEAAKSFGATLSRSFGPIKCGGRTPKTPFTGPLRPWMTTRSPATVGIVTPPFGIR